MADAVVRLRVESSEYDQKLSRATQQLQHMEKEVRRTGATFAYADKEELEFIKSLGKMDTQTSSAKGQLREMTDSIMQMTQVYKQLTDEEKASPFGRALTASLDELKNRASEVKDMMTDLNREIGGMASDTQVFDEIAGSVGLMVSVFQVGQGALQAFGVENEEAAQAIAKLQGAMAVTSGLQKIQNALQKESNVMQGVAKVQDLAAAAAEAMLAKAKEGNVVATKAATIAQKALNAVANANPYVLLATAIVAVGTALWAMSKASKAAADEEEKRLKASEEAERKANESREAFVNASADAMASASHISALQVAYKNANSEMEKTGVLKQAQEEFKKLGISCNSVTEAQTLLMNKGGQIIQLLKMQGTIAALNAVRMEKYKESFNNLLANGYDVAGAAALAGANKDVQELDNQIISLQTKSQGIKSDLGIGETKSTGTKSSAKSTPQKSLLEQRNEQIKKVTASIQEMNDVLASNADEGTKAWATQQLERYQGELDTLNGKLKETQDNLEDVEEMTGPKETAFEQFSRSVATKQADDAAALDNTTLTNLMGVAIQNGIDSLNPDFESLYQKMFDGENIPDEAWQSLVDEINAKLEEMNLPPIKLDVQTGNVEKVTKDAEAFKTAWSSAAGAIGQVGGALQQIDDPGAKIAGIIMEAVANVASGFAQMLASPSATSEAWGWIALAISGVTTMISTISAIKSVTSGNYASGGIIGGNSYSGDNMRGVLPNGDLIGLNSGEVVLNAAQQNTLAGHLAGNNPMQNLQLSTEISGTNLRIVMNNDNRSKGGSRGYYANIH